MAPRLMAQSRAWRRHFWGQAFLPAHFHPSYLGLHPIFTAFPSRTAPGSFGKFGYRRRVNSALSNLRPGLIVRSEEHTSELQSHSDLVCRLLLEKKNKQ